MLKFLAHFFSVVFHPLIILTYMLIILLLVNPYLFGVNNIAEHKVLILLIFFSTFFIPAMAVVIMKLLDLITSIQMENRQERIGPYIATGIFYLWLFRTLLDNPEIPTAFKVFVLGATIGLFVGFFINNFTKISMHTIGIGGLLAMVIITTNFYSYGTFSVDLFSLGLVQVNTSLLLILVVLLTGIVTSARLFLNAHNVSDVLGGLIVGISTQFIALQILA